MRCGLLLLLFLLGLRSWVVKGGDNKEKEGKGGLYVGISGPACIDIFFLACLLSFFLCWLAGWLVNPVGSSTPGVYLFLFLVCRFVFTMYLR